MWSLYLLIFASSPLTAHMPSKTNLKMKINVFFFFFLFLSMQDYYSFLMKLLLLQALFSFLKSHFHIILRKIFDRSLPIDPTALKKKKVSFPCGDQLQDLSSIRCQNVKKKSCQSTDENINCIKYSISSHNLISGGFSIMLIGLCFIYAVL